MLPQKPRNDIPPFLLAFEKGSGHLLACFRINEVTERSFQLGQRYKTPQVSAFGDECADPGKLNHTRSIAKRTDQLNQRYFWGQRCERQCVDNVHARRLRMTSHASRPGRRGWLQDLSAELLFV